MPKMPSGFSGLGGAGGSSGGSPFGMLIFSRWFDCPNSDEQVVLQVVPVERQTLQASLLV
jgi:hypothetical protein